MGRTADVEDLESGVEHEGLAEGEGPFVPDRTPWGHTGRSGGSDTAWRREGADRPSGKPSNKPTNQASKQATEIRIHPLTHTHSINNPAAHSHTYTLTQSLANLSALTH